MTDFQVEVDARNLSCPMPVMRAKKALKGMICGEILHVVATDPASVQDLEILLSSLEDEMVEQTEASGEYHFYIKKS